MISSDVFGKHSCKHHRLPSKSPCRSNLRYAVRPKSRVAKTVISDMASLMYVLTHPYMLSARRFFVNLL
jgi:hypothetical protein